MRADCTGRPQYAPFLDQHRDFGRKRRKCGQSTQKTSDDKQPPFGSQAGIMGKNGKGDTDQITANQICH